MLVAGPAEVSLRIAENSYQIYVVKRMIRGLGVETTLNLFSNFKYVRTSRLFVGPLGDLRVSSGHFW